MAAPQMTHGAPQGMVPVANHHAHPSNPQFLHPGMGQAGAAFTTSVPGTMTMMASGPSPQGNMAGPHHASHEHANGLSGTPSPPPPHSTSPTHEESATNEGGDKPSQSGGNGGGSSNLAHCA